MTDRRPAVLFDIDGTLVDTNWFHTLSWWRGFQDAGENIAMSRIHPLIGMGSDTMLDTLFGEQRQELKDGHTRHFDAFKSEIRAFPKATELLVEVAKRGARVVLATSSKESDLEEMLQAIDADDHITEIVHGDDVDESKPSPDIFATALEKTGLDASDAIVVGDTRWDIEAAAKAGLKVVGVLTGGTTRQDLMDAGAEAVYEDVADLLANLDDSPVARFLDRESAG